MKTYRIDSFTDKSSGLHFQGGTVFREGKRCLLHEPGGHIILFDAELAEELQNGIIPDALFSHLQSRGFLTNLSKVSSCAVRPEFFMVDLTNRCNMKCAYCLRNVDTVNDSMREEVLEKICRYIQEYCDSEGLMHVSIQAWGGEPLLEMESILKMRKLIRPQKTKVHFSVETNGILLDQEMIEKLYENRIGIGISIDGTEQTHNAQRVFSSGAGTHHIVMDHLCMAKKKYGDRLGTITTITRKNAEHIEEILEFFAVEAELRDVKFNFVHESQFTDCSDLCLSSEEIASVELRLFRKMAELVERGYPIAEHNIKTKLKNLLFNQYSDICLSQGCCGGKKMIVFDMEGRIYPCELTDTPEQSIGSIYDKTHTLPELIKKGMAENPFFTVKKADKCVKCPWYCYCKGGCTVRIMSRGEFPPAVDEIECAINTILYPAMAELILTRPETVNSILGFEAVIL